MSVTHEAIPYEDEFLSEQFIKWYGKPVPEYPRYGRLLDWKELQAALDASIPDGYKLIYDDASNPVMIYINHLENDSHLLHIEVFGLRIDEDMFHRFAFSGDRGYLEKLIQFFPEECGTFLVITNGEDPEVIIAGK